MSGKYSFTQVNADSPFIGAAARLHSQCLPYTISSKRGAKTLEGIYRNLAKQGHLIYLAIANEQVVGGIVVTHHEKNLARPFTVLYRPYSWLTAISGLGIVSFTQQVFDLLHLQRLSRKFTPHDYIVAVYVAESARRTGLGKALVRHAVTHAQVRDVAVVVDTHRDNHSAIHLYSSLGFIAQRKTALSTLFTLGLA